MKSPLALLRQKALLILAALLLLVAQGAALQCYFCSINDPACLDPFTPDNSTMQQTCPSWSNICIKTVELRTKDDRRHVLRGCFRDSFQGVDGCMMLRMAARSEGMDILACNVCTTDFCNDF
ncbi:uncharacterized protein LOC132197436 isoform X2 [Neocloeon triangulifer]|uniref:uncharacterized protein LOC132197436 isoform X2 n=1 Tax=Neocloeon triangulifer TaxID=2078957 RepID=UPI00286F198C|nr:uncharacterized protein LOC132197436 isoform X2 [Neocloeon triangulifer]